MPRCASPGCPATVRARGLCGYHYGVAIKGGSTAELLLPSKKLGSVPDDLLHAAGISYRQLDYWTRRGFLCPEQTEPGSGRSRRWSLAELDVAERMAALVSAGLTPEAAVRAARRGAEAWLSDCVKVSVIT